ncbi:MULTISPECIES: hypothetical protein [Pseudomonas]|uniref:CdiI immunity protein domain-containing protein n=1 Tax=Pseudomonas quercus TaxID=2722792 RepID=A0ABX0YF10_9PSED|nr:MULTISPECIES: hypothetical protein [Pseudomonas]MBF7143115.1 hypothetical protein [Pseudomonas sp. LY10J]NJP01857.1 hypothetical protein [Pseudomonas quercus]
MKYGLINDFIYDVGDAVGEFLPEEEKIDLTPINLEDIVKKYIDERNLLNVFFLKRQIKIYIKSHMTPDGLEYAYPPFGQDTSFVEDYFEGALHTFFIRVISLLDLESKNRLRSFLSNAVKKVNN